jgi:hypothetical protein
MLTTLLASYGKVALAVAGRIALQALPPLVLGTIGDTAAAAVTYFGFFLGSILALMLMYGGYLWMFHQEDAERVNRGKQLCIRAGVGGMFVAICTPLASDLTTKVFK